MQSTIYSLTAVVVLLIANGFFVAAEFALVKARNFRIATLANQGSSTARLTLKIQAKLEAYLAACQLGITMASLGLGWVGEPAVAALLEPLFHWIGVPDAILHTVAFIVGFLIFSSLHIVVGEQVPKTFAIRQPEPVSLWVAYPLHIAYLLVFPLNWLLNGATRSILSIFNVQEATHAEILSGDELKGLVATSKEHGEIGEVKADMLRNLFEFDQRLIGRVMIPFSSLEMLDIAADADENLRIIRDSGHSRFPVVDGRQDSEIVGLVLAKDLYVAMLQGIEEPWRNLEQYCRDPLVVPESQKVSQLFELMRARRAHMALVVDEYGELVGIVTLEDLLEEIVGEIHDETDSTEQPGIIAATIDGCWEADGLASLSDAERIIGMKVPDELDANTISGLCLQHLRRMPEEGDIIEEYGYRISVMTVVDRHVGRVLIEKINARDEAQEALTANAANNINNNVNDNINDNVNNNNNNNL